jgi:hypothetical protein
MVFSNCLRNQKPKLPNFHVGIVLYVLRRLYGEMEYQ